MNNYPTIYYGTEEINLRTNNFILIEGNKNTGKSFLSIKLLEKIQKNNNKININIFSNQTNKYFTNLTNVETDSNLLDLLESIHLYIQNNYYELFDKLTTQTIYYIDGLDIKTDKEWNLFRNIISLIKFSSVTLICSSRNIEIKERTRPDLLIRMNYNDDYSKLLFLHQSSLYDKPVKKVVQRENIEIENIFDKNISLFKYLNTLIRKEKNEK